MAESIRIKVKQAAVFSRLEVCGVDGSERSFSRVTIFLEHIKEDAADRVRDLPVHADGVFIPQEAWHAAGLKRTACNDRLTQVAKATNRDNVLYRLNRLHRPMLASSQLWVS